MTEQETAVALWRERLSTAQLPLLSSSEVVEKLLSAAVSLQQVAHLLANDPALALEIILAAARLPAARGDVQGLQHALNLLGMKRIQALIRVRMTRVLNPESNAHRSCLQAITTSRFAASLVSRWEEPRVPGSSELLSCVTLLLGLARWKLPLAAPQVSQQLERRVANGERRSRVEQELLGCSIDALNQAVLIDAGFPSDSLLLRSIDPDGAMLARASRYAWTDTIAPELPIPIARWLRQRTSPCLIAHLLACAAHDGWYEPRAQALLRVVSARNNTPLARVINATHRTAVHVSRRLEHHAGLIFTPAEQLFWAPRPSRSPSRQRGPEPITASIGQARKNAAQPTPELVASPAPRGPVPAENDVPAASPRSHRPPASVPSQANASSAQAAAAHIGDVRANSTAKPAAPGGNTRTDPQRLHAFIRKCRDNAFPDLRQLMHETGIALDKGLALRRSLLFLRPGNSEQVRCYLKHGFDDALASAPLEVSTDSENLLMRLLQQGGTLRVDSATSQAAMRQLPEVLRKLALPSGFALTCIKMNDRPLGLIWADSGNARIEVNPAQYDALRVVTGHFNTAFSQLARGLKK